MPYPFDFTEIATDRAAGNPEHVNDHKLIAENLNAAIKDLMEAKGTAPNLAELIKEILAALELIGDTPIVVKYDDEASTWPARPDTERVAFWFALTSDVPDPSNARAYDVVYKGQSA